MVLPGLGRGGVAAALRVAAAGGHVRMVDMLLKARASVFETDSNATSSLMLAAEAGHAQVCKILLKQSPALFDLRNRKRQNAYDLAVGMCKSAAVRAMKPHASDKVPEIDDQLENYSALSLEAKTVTYLTYNL